MDSSTQRSLCFLVAILFVLCLVLVGDAYLNNKTMPILAVAGLAFMLQGVVFGCLTQTLAEKKGYVNAYFWTGFLLSLIGLIYVACLPVRANTSAPPAEAKND